jgi:tetratricopeptide (TPR) repeat protein
MRHCRKIIIATLIGLVSTSEVGLSQYVTGASLADEIRACKQSIDAAHGHSSWESWLKLAMLYQDAAQYEDAERAYGESIRLLKADDPIRLAYALDGMGTLYVEMGAYSKAEPLEQKALAIREERKDSVGIGRSRMHLAVLSLGTHELTEAASEAEQAVNLLVPEGVGIEAGSGGTPEEKMTALIDLSLVRCAQGKCAEALPHLRRALNFARSNYTTKSIPVGFLNFLIGYASWKSGDSRRAGKLMKTGLSEMDAEIGWGHPTYVSALMQYETFLLEKGRNVEASRIRAEISLTNSSHRQEEQASGEAVPWEGSTR